MGCFPACQRVWLRRLANSTVWTIGFVATATAAELTVPRAHDRPPGPPLSPSAALSKMVVPQGFAVDLVAAEPDIVNPVAMCVDAQGRFWVTESFEYPRAAAGPGRDRIKVLEDTDRDGRVDRVTIFAEGLNIPSGIAVDEGGVWVANAPDLLYLQDTNGDLKADQRRVLLTGFGRTDTHELPSALTWGPDGWLYGLNGVFNHSHVTYGPDNRHADPAHPGWSFTCALWRIDPQTGEFNLFAQGTSNPWGVAINQEGDFFVSACVIDHLWHLAESAYYIRQGGPYPPHTWPLASIVQHTHQKAAYCGITWFDTDGYPDLYRRMLVMGNIHGNCLNVDRITRANSSYQGTPHPGFPAAADAWRDDTHGVIRRTGPSDAPLLADLLNANDPWFMPVAQMTGADGHLYVLDWYDRYHCYQDAMADSEGIDRGRGRLYRIRFKDAPLLPISNLSQADDEDLLKNLLHGPSEYHRHTARRILGERLRNITPPVDTIQKLAKVARAPGQPAQDRLHAAWALASGKQLDSETLVMLRNHSKLSEELAITLDAWAIRWLGERNEWDWQQWRNAWEQSIAQRTTPLQRRVWLQFAIAFGKLLEREANSDPAIRLDIVRQLLHLGGQCSDDPVIPGVVWQNVLPTLTQTPAIGLQLLEASESAAESLPAASSWRALYTARILHVLCDSSRTDATLYGSILRNTLTNPTITADDRDRQLVALTHRINQGNLPSADQPQLAHAVRDMSLGNQQPSYALQQLLVALGDRTAVDLVAERALDGSLPPNARLLAFQSLVHGTPASATTRRVARTWLDRALADVQHQEFCRDLILAWASDSGDDVGEALLSRIPQMNDSLRAATLELLSQRSNWSQQLLAAIDQGTVNASELNYHHIQRLVHAPDAQLREAATKVFGHVRQGRREDRQAVIDKVRSTLANTPGDPQRGRQVFQRTCATCHKIYGQGADVGPDITRNGRNNFDQLLQNIFDPSLVIGPGFQARVLITTTGRSLIGIPLEESETRVVLKIAGGQVEAFPRDEIEVYQTSDVSLMPEGLENQLPPQELADLLQFLALTERPEEEDAKWIPGTPAFPKPASPSPTGDGSG